MFVDNDFRLGAGGVEVGMNKVHFSLHRRQVLLRPSLKHKTVSELGQVGNAGNIQENILGQYCGQARQNLFGLPALALEVYDVRLHEHGTAVAEDGHSLRGEGDVGVLVHGNTQRLRGGLQEIAIAGRALRVELEVLNASVFQDDELDVLPADVHDHVRVLIEAHG